MSVVEAADKMTLERGYGEFVKEAKALDPTYQARSVCTDAWEATRQAWRRLFLTITVVLCFLHSILKIQQHCAGPLRHQILDRAWRVYQAATKRQVAQRLRRLAEWTPGHLSGPVATMVLKMHRRRADFTPAYECPQAHRTSNAVDRLINFDGGDPYLLFLKRALCVAVVLRLVDKWFLGGSMENFIPSLMSRVRRLSQEAKARRKDEPWKLRIGMVTGYLMAGCFFVAVVRMTYGVCWRQYPESIQVGAIFLALIFFLAALFYYDAGDEDRCLLKGID